MDQSTSSIRRTDNNKGGFLLLQSDWNTAISNVGSRVWVTSKLYGCNHASSHEEISVKDLNNGQPVFEVPECIQIKDVSKHTITISNVTPTHKITTQFVAPVQEFHIHQKAITAFDISKAGGLGVSASIDGMFCVWDTSHGNIRRRLSGHVGDVNCCKFFPSGLVVLSGGMDTQLKIWSAEDGSCPRTLRGSHTGGILDIDFIERGQEVVSCSRDGSMRLWRCGSGECVDTSIRLSTAINSCHITSIEYDLSQRGDSNITDSAAMGRKYKLFAVASDGGTLHCCKLDKNEPMFCLAHNAPLNCCRFLNSTTLVAASQDGTILVADLRWPKEFVISLKPCESPVHYIHPSSIRGRSCFWVACGNGRCSLYSVVIKHQPSFPPYVGELELICELTGPDCDPVYHVVETDDGWVYTSSRDSLIRKYKLAYIN